MTTVNATLKYPIGRFERPGKIDRITLNNWIAQIETLPERLLRLTNPLSSEQLDTPYRPDGWTVRQVLHHIADSHTNSYIRFKWALTESKPTIKAYDEKAWADLFDTRTAPIELSLSYLRALHAKWVYLLKGLSDSDLQKEFIHPSTQNLVPLDENIGLYAWHGEHHYMHIKNLIDRKGWFSL